MLQESRGQEIDKTAVDSVLHGITISIHPSSNFGDMERPAVADSVGQLIQCAVNENPVDLTPLRLVLITGNLGEAVTYWEAALALPPSGLSNQSEGVAVGKHMTWGNDEQSARSIIILADYVAASAALDNPAAVATIAHELGHVHDDFGRGMHLGFPETGRPPNLNDWPGLCECIADNTWSEYAAESVGAYYMAPTDIREFMLNDTMHLEGVHGRLQQGIESFRSGGSDMPSLWSSAVTNLYDGFANLGRAVARFPLAVLDAASPDPLVKPDGVAACWSPVVESLVKELHALGDKGYAEWDANPFHALKIVVGAGFAAAGFAPVYDGKNLRVGLR